MKLESHLHKHFGYKEFRPLQKEVIEHTMESNDCVVLMPTGGGKSICYQLPAVIEKGLTIVISPLIALMKDQVEALKGNGIEAEYLNSTLSEIDEQIIFQSIADEHTKLLYISPEKLFSTYFLDYLKGLNINRFAIDEAHCISSWGHHFRPEYSKLYILKEHFPDVPLMALTATADKAVRADISELLKMDNAEYFISSFDRPNISLAVLPGQKKWEQVLSILNRHKKGSSGIIYCSSRKGTESLAMKLKGIGINALPYHAGLNADIRSKTQEQFQNDQIDIIVATIAFGMGIDKANVRFVIHFNMPGNLDSYYQEFGRGGRDGLPAEAILFYSYRDVQTHLGFIEENTNPQHKEILKVKLQRMQEYAEAQQCRRTILLTYFSEIPDCACGNCDVCSNPPKFFDGTTYAQMVLSALKRSHEAIGLTILIDVLKGRINEEVRNKGLDKIKTFGVGRDLTYFAWQVLIQQIIQLGAIEIDYKDDYHLKVTSLGEKILFGKESIQLVEAQTIIERQKRQKEVKIEKVKAGPVDNTLLAELKKLRKKLASEINKPAFVVFSNLSLEDMSKKKPSNLAEFMQVNGVGEHKAKRYGNAFLNAIADYARPSEAQENITQPKKKKEKGATYKETLVLVRSGLSLEDISKERNLKATTILSHITNLLEQGEEINALKFINPEDFKKVKTAHKKLGNLNELKPYFEYLNEEIDYGTIRLSLRVLRNQK